MPEYLAPGVYVEEVDTGAKPIEGVSTSTSGMVGVTERGPEGTATLVTSFADFVRQFGGYLDDRLYTGSTWYLPHSVEGFFVNGGKRVYVVRVLPDSADFARSTLFDRGDTPDVPGGVSFTRFSRELMARVGQGDQILLLDDSADLDPSGGDWALLQDGPTSEYVQIAPGAAGVVAISTPIRAALLPAGTPVIGFTDLDAGGSQVDTTTLAADVLRNEFLLPLADAGLLAGSLSYRIGSPPNAEVHNAADNGAVALTAPLALNHNPTPVAGQGQWTDPAARTLDAAANIGDTILKLVNRTLVTVPTAAGSGQQLRITGGGNTEDVRVDSVTLPRTAGADPGDVTITTGLARAYAVGATVVLLDPPLTPVVEPAISLDPVARRLTRNAPRGTTQVAVNNRTGILDPALPAGQVHFLQFTNAAGDSEFVRIDTVDAPRAAAPDPGAITLEWALQRDYAAGDTVTLLLDTGIDTNPTFLAWDVDPDDRALVLGDSGAYGPGSFIRIERIGAANSEYNRVPAGAPAPVLRVLDSPLGSAHPAATPVLGRSQVLRVQAIDRGVWGNMLRILADQETNPLLRETSPSAAAPATSPTVRLRTAVGVEVGSILEFFTRDASGRETVTFGQKVESVSGNVIGFGAGGISQAVLPSTLVRTVEFQMRVQLMRTNPRTRQQELVTEEFFRQLSLDPRHSRYVVTVLGAIPTGGAIGRTQGESSFVRVADLLPQAAAQAAVRTGLDSFQYTPPGGQPRRFGPFFTGGNDDIGSIGPGTYVGSDGTNPPASRTGIFALKNIDEISIVAAPGQTDQQVQQALLDHCQLLRYRFAVLDAAEGLTVALVQDQRSLYDSKYGAIYYPWLRIPDPFPDNPRIRSLVSVPPSGHVIGVYARSDIERGVHKAPANEVIGGISDLEAKLTKEEQDILNPRNVNVLRNFRESNRGLRVWGARTLTGDQDWKYINVRRLFIFVEHSIDRGTQWVVFEPNSEPLWERVKRVITAFLTSVWRDGALMGKTPEEAFFVRADRTTMTQADIDNGKLIVQIGIAPVKPAEFVIFRIGQWAGGSELEEG